MSSNPTNDLLGGDHCYPHFTEKESKRSKYNLPLSLQQEGYGNKIEI